MLQKSIPGSSVWRGALVAIGIALLVTVSLGADNTPPKTVGTPGSRITIEIFSDFQCPGCKQLHIAIMRRLLDDYVLPGKVYLVYRDFPLPIHQHARQAARYANAAASLGKYDEVSDALFRTQEVWSKNGQFEPILARVLTKTEMKKLQELARQPGIESSIERDVKLGMQYRISVTPTMRVTANGKVYPIPGVVQYDVLRNFLESLLQ